MKLFIRLYGDPILRKTCKNINNNFPNLKNIISNMFNIMYKANGIGLAAIQIGIDIRLFIIDASSLINNKKFEYNKNELQKFKKVFINPKIIEKKGEICTFEEGCLSIPTIRENIDRLNNIILEYYDENFNHKVELFSDIEARIIQHEYDHLEGILFIDHLSILKKKILEKKLKNIAKKKYYIKLSNTKLIK